MHYPPWRVVFFVLFTALMQLDGKEIKTIPRRFMTHNLYYGLQVMLRQTPKSLSTNTRLLTTISNYFDWLNRQPVDYVALNELNGWGHLHVENNELRADIESFGRGAAVVAARHGWSLIMLQTNRGFDIGFAARLPEKNSNASSLRVPSPGHLTQTEGFHHGLLHCELRTGITQSSERTIHVLVTHLSPHSSKARRKEATAICNAVNSLRYAGHPDTIVLGDFNTLSPHDKILLDSNSGLPVLDLFRQKTKLREKFLFVDTATQAFVIDYSVMEILHSCLVDLVAFDKRNNNTSHQTTVPTDIVEDKMHAAPLRLDYILATPSLVAQLRTNIADFKNSGAVRDLEEKYPPFTVETLRTAESRVMSDHFPVFLKYNDPKDGLDFMGSNQIEISGRGAIGNAV